MDLEAVLPNCLCSTCTMATIEAINFRTFCSESRAQWVKNVDLLEAFPEYDDIPKRNKGIFVIIQENSLNLINDCTGRLQTAKAVVNRLRNRLYQIHNNDHREKLMKDTKRCECPDCGKRFFYAHHLNLHLNESDDNKRACQHCAKIMTRDELVQHLIEIHNRRPYACSKCPALYKSLKKYKRHIVRAHAPSAFTCGDCARTFKSNQAFNAHLSIHSSKTCTVCGKIFRNQPCFSYHVKECLGLASSEDDQCNEIQVAKKRGRKRSKIGPKSCAVHVCYCDYCGKKFSGKKYVKAHIQIVHSQSTHTPCIYCGKFLPAAYMTEHVKKHELIRTYTCNYCGIVLKSDLGIKQHLRLHTGEKPYSCKYCEESFSASSRRSEHIRKIHKTNITLRHACAFCPARFRLPYRLRNHMDTVHSNTDSKKPQFECSTCREKFGSYRGLIHHSRKHQRIEMKGVSRNEKAGRDISKFKVYSEGFKGPFRKDI